MIPIKSYINILVFSCILLLVSCVKDSSKKTEVKGSPEVLNRLIANNITPADFPSKTQSIITLSYTSVDGELASSCVLSQLNHVSITQACSCDQLGVCSVGVTADAGYTGAGTFAYNVVANGKTSTTGRAQFSILAPPPGSNIPPTISSIPAKTTTEGVSVSNSFTVADVDSSVSCVNVTASSSNTTVVPNANVVISGSGSSCTVTVTPAASQVGSSNITLTLTDTGTPLPAQTALSTFTVTVNGYNDPPTISAISNQITLEDTATTPIAFTIGDADSTVTCADVSATSSNTSLVSNASITISGAAQSCTITLAPNLNLSGTTAVTLSLTDHGMPLPAKTVTTNFTLTVAPVNDAPVVAPISNQSTTEGVLKAVNFTITDVDSNLNCNSSVAITSSNTALVPNTNITITGIAPNCTASITPVNGQSGSSTLTVAVSDNGFPLPIQTTTRTFAFQVTKVNQAPTISAIADQTTNEDGAISGINFTIGDSDSTVYCSNVAGTSSNTSVVSNGNIVVTGTAPNCTVAITPVGNAYGNVTITLTLTDNGTPLPGMTAVSVFNLTINAVNDVPTMAVIANQSTNMGTASAPFAIPINDVDSTLSCTANLSATSTNTALIPTSNIVFGGTAPNCNAIITPAAGVYGTSDITLTVTDNGTPLPALTASRLFTMTVNQVNQAPVISAISNQTTNEDTTISGIAFSIADSDSTIYCNNVTATSSNTALVPNANITITGTAPNCFASITPVANGFGSTVITLTLTDTGTPLPVKTATSIFSLTVDAVNDAPVISTVTNKSTDEDTASNSIAVTINDSDSSLTCAGSLSGTSSNTTLVPNANIVVSGTAPNCSVVITPASNRNGSSTITLTVSDNGTPMPAQTASTSFVLTVTAVPDLSGALALSNLSGVASSYTGNTYGRQITFTGLTSDENLSSFEICLGTAAGSCDVSSWVEATGYTTSGSAPTISLGGSYRLKSGVGGAQVFTLTPSCSSTTSYYYSVRATNVLSRTSNIVSTPAWSFWEPSCLGSSLLAQWLDASEASTITVATGVSNWTDKSGNGRTVTQATTTKQPVYSATGIGTLPGVTFNGTSHTLTRAAFAYAFSSSSYFTVIKANTVAANRFVFSEASSVTNSTYYSPLATTTTSTITGAAVSSANVAQLNFPASSAPFFNGTIRLAMSEDTGTTFTTWSNGTSQTQPVTNYTRPSSTMDTYRLGGRIIRTTESNWFAGTIGEFFIFNGVLSAAQRLRMEGYTAHKWGVSASLPGGHTYLTTPP